MTISAAYAPDQYDGNDVTTNFAVTFPFFLEGEIEVIVTVDATGVEDTKVLNTDYTVTGGGTDIPDDGEIDFLTGAPATGETVTIRRLTDQLQAVDLTRGGPLAPNSVEGALDRAIMLAQEAQEALDRCLRVPKSDDPTNDMEIASEVDRASSYQGFDADGLPIPLAAPTDIALTTTWSETLLENANAEDARADILAGVIDARGDMMVGDSTPKAATLSKGTAGQVVGADANDVLYLTPWDENAIINGCGRVAQRGAYTLVKDTWDHGKCDRWEGMATGTLVSAGTLTQSTSAAIGTTGVAIHFDGVTLTGAGEFFLRQRIEERNARRFKNGPMTVQLAMRMDCGKSVGVTVTVNKADAADDFSSTTNIGDDGGTTVLDATNTTITYTIADMGDCSNGIEIEIALAPGEITTKDFWFTEIQAVPRLSAPDFSWCSFEDELARCERYFCKTFDHETAPAQSAGDAGALSCIGQFGGGDKNVHFVWHFPTSMRSTPTLVTYSPSDASADAYNVADASVTAVTTDYQGTAGATFYAEDATDYQDRMILHATAEAEL